MNRNCFDLNKEADRLCEWIRRVSAGMPAGRFRYCIQGGLTETAKAEAAFVSCFALKTLHHCGRHEKFPSEVAGALDFIASFQHQDGFFRDPWLQRAPGATWKNHLAAWLGRCAKPLPTAVRRHNNLTADTRQLASVLLEYGRVPHYPLPVVLPDAETTGRYIEKMNWEVPWGCGSHLSHAVFFLSANRRYFDLDRNYEAVLDEVLAKLAELEHPENGCWYRGNISDAMKINGAMKIYSMLNWVDRPRSDAAVRLEFALRQPFVADGCGFLNRLYVVWNAVKDCDATPFQDEIRRLVADSLDYIERFRTADGGFSFNAGAAEHTYFGCRVSRGLPEGDMHGAVMFSWVLALCRDLCPEQFVNGQDWQASRS